MSASCASYLTLKTKLQPLLIYASHPQQSNLALFVYGLFLALHCQLPKIALRLPLRIRAASLTQRLERFLKNPLVEASVWYKPFARHLLAPYADGQVRLILDATDLGDRFPMLFVALCYRGRALPILWKMLPTTGCSTAATQKALLAQVAPLLPCRCTVTLLGDREYGSAELIRFCHQQGWHFCLRAKKNRHFTAANGQKQQMKRLPLLPGKTYFLDNIRLPDLPTVRLCLSCGWSSLDKDDEPWYILSDLPAGGRVLALYAKRFLVEQMFRDFKEQGFRLESTHLQVVERVSRLVLCVCIAYVWLLNAGVFAVKLGLRRHIDRHKVRQISYFQIGLRFLMRAFVLGEELRCAFSAYP